MRQLLRQFARSTLWLPGGRGHIGVMSLESDPRWPVFIEKVKTAVQAGGGAPA